MSEVTVDRRSRLRDWLSQQGIGAGLVTTSANVRYLTGFTGSTGALLLTADGLDVLATDLRYLGLAKAQAYDVELLDTRTAVAALGERAGATVSSVAIETHHITLDEWEALRNAQQRLQFTSLKRAVERMRQRKDDGELELLRHAAAISCRAWQEILELGFAGRSERAMADEFERRLRGHGADSRAFPTIVASGPNAAVPHHRPSDRLIERGDLVTVDFGACYEGYHSDCTRTVAIGGPTTWQHEVHAVVQVAQAAGRAALVPGAELSAVDAAARELVDAAGYGGHFDHGLGHGVGLQLHEDPFVNADAAGRIEARASVTVEPGICLPGYGGVRIEDTLVVRDGAPELLTPVTKDLVVLD